MKQHTSPSVLIAILNWNGQHYLKQFLPSVLQTNYSNFKILLIDNASTDDSVAFVQAEFPEVSVKVLPENLGFAGGYNAGLQNEYADYFVLLNSDVEVTPNWLQPLISQMEKEPKIAVIQPQIRSFAQKNHFEHAGAAGGFIDLWGFPFCRGRIFNHVEANENQYDTNIEVFWATGAAFCIRAELWEAEKGLDEDFFAHMEEIDLCWRLKNKGYQIWANSESHVYHVGGGTLAVGSPFKNYLNFRNNLYMLQKNLPSKGRAWKLFFRMFIDFIAWLRFLTEGKFQHAWSVNKSHYDFLKHYRKTEKKRLPQLPEGTSKIYQKSIIWAFYFNKIQKFNRLEMDKFSHS